MLKPSWAQDLEPGSGPETSVSGTTDENQPRFRVHSDLVVVPVTVTTTRGRVVPGLAKDHFSVLEDGVPQVITHFTSEDAPATIGVVFDSSGSMSPRLAKAQEAVYALLRIANPEDEFFLIRFNDRPERLVSLTRRADEVHRAVETLEVSGTTAVYDAVNLAWLEMTKAHHPRKAIILISDGEDNASRITETEFQQLASESDTAIFTLYLGVEWDESAYQRPNKPRGASVLEDIARQSGGCMYVVDKLKQLPEIASKIGSWIRSQYVLGYVPANGSRNGGYHRIQVKISKPVGFPKLQSFWRLGYLAPVP